jgi:hypothetical protein
MLIFNILAMVMNHLNYAGKYEGSYAAPTDTNPRPRHGRRQATRPAAPHTSSSVSLADDAPVAR